MSNVLIKKVEEIGRLFALKNERKDLKDVSSDSDSDELLTDDEFEFKDTKVLLGNYKLKTKPIE